MTGQIRFSGEDLLAATWDGCARCAGREASVVFQGAMSALNPVQTIGDQIREPILLHEKVGEKEARARAAELLDSVGVPSRRLGSYPHEFSGGQRQRVMIAMALACRPDLIIADEPTTALDVIVQAQILSLLTDLVRECGISLIMISHDLSVLAETCDRLAVMYAGRLVEIGPSAAGHRVRRGTPTPGRCREPSRPSATALAAGAGRSAGRPARPPRRARRLPVRAAMPRGTRRVPDPARSSCGRRTRTAGRPASNRLRDGFGGAPQEPSGAERGRRRGAGRSMGGGFDDWPN